MNRYKNVQRTKIQERKEHVIKITKNSQKSFSAQFHSENVNPLKNIQRTTIQSTLANSRDWREITKIFEKRNGRKSCRENVRGFKATSVHGTSARRSTGGKKKKRDRSAFSPDIVVSSGELETWRTGEKQGSEIEIVATRRERETAWQRLTRLVLLLPSPPTPLYRPVFVISFFPPSEIHRGTRSRSSSRERPSLVTLVRDRGKIGCPRTGRLLATKDRSLC